LIDTIAADAPSDTIWLTYMPSRIDTITKVAGSYEARIFITSGSVFGSTMSAFVVRASRDIAPARIITPAEGTVKQGETIPVVARLYNLGTTVERDVRVRLTILSGSGGVPYIDSAVVTGDWAPMEFRDVAFRDYVAASPGTVEFRVCAIMPGDSITFNDCINQHTISVIRNVDLSVAPSIGSLHFPPPDSRQSVADSIPIQVEIRKSGSGDARDIPVQVTIYGPDDQVVYSNNVRVDLVGTQSVMATLRRFKTESTGIYRLRAFIQGLDSARGNDTLFWSFKAVLFARLAAIDPSEGYNEPVPNSKIQRGLPSPVQLTFSNHSPHLLDSVPITVQIRNNAGTLVYDETMNALGVASDSAVFIQRLPDFTPTVNGRYCVTAWVMYEDDTVRSDDTSRWCFDVIGTGSVASPWVEGHADYSLAILPNPVRDNATLRYRTPEGTRWHAMLYDAAGREVRELCNDCAGGEGVLEISLDGIPSGRYTVALESSRGVRIVEALVIQR
jgi:hypothetical protein